MKLLLAAIAGVLFALGLVLADMTSPARIRAFLDVGGAWDPTLAFVMAGAIGVYAPLARVANRRAKPLFEIKFYWPEIHGIDKRLVGGAALFGIGWGLSGYCPGPALVSLGTGALPVLAFVGAMLGGIVGARLLFRER